jgi:hypothetical protein
VNYTIDFVKLFELESILAFKIEIIIPFVQKGHLCEKWAWDVSSTMEVEAIDYESCNVEQNAAQQALQEWYQHLYHRVFVE